MNVIMNCASQMIARKMMDMIFILEKKEVGFDSSFAFAFDDVMWSINKYNAETML